MGVVSMGGVCRSVVAAMGAEFIRGGKGKRRYIMGQIRGAKKVEKCRKKLAKYLVVSEISFNFTK